MNKEIYTLRYTDMTPGQHAAAIQELNTLPVNYEYDQGDTSWLILVLPTDDQITQIDAALAAVA